MTISEKLLEKEIEDEQHLESYKNSAIKGSLVYYRKFHNQAGRILRPYFGTKLNLNQYRGVASEIKQSLNEFEDSYKEYITSEVSDAAQVFLEIERDKIKKITGIDPKVPVVTATSLMALSVPLEEGRVVSINSLLNGNIQTIERDLKMTSSRLRILQEDRSVVSGYYTNAVRKNQGYIDVTVATILAIIAGRIKYLFALQNKEVFRGYVWVSVIDGKTSDYCIVRHTQYWDFDDNSRSTLPAEEYPPGHFRCRSGISYIYRGEGVPDMPSYEEWFERQPEKVQREILGQGRFDLYTKGELDIKTFIDAESGKRITLNQFRELTSN